MTTPIQTIKPKAYSYIRFSSQKQSKGHSKGRQWEACVKWCAENDVVLDLDMTFLDAASGWSKAHIGEGGHLARLLTYVENGSIAKGSWIVVESLDRLGRDHVHDALTRFTKLLTDGINVVTLSDGKKWQGTPDFMQLMHCLLVMSVAFEESEKKSYRLKAKWVQNRKDAESGMGGKQMPPMWLKLEGGNYEPIPERVLVVERIFDLSRQGNGKARIAVLLNADNTPTFKPGPTTKGWGPSSIDKVLRNRAVFGEMQPYTLSGKERREPIGEPIRGFFPVVISEDVFLQADALINSRRKFTVTHTTSYMNIWQGIIKCVLCEGSMHMMDKGAPPRGSKYMVCANRKKGTCTAAYIRLDSSELVFKEILSKVDSLSLVEIESEKVLKELDIIEGRIIGQKKKVIEYVVLMEEVRTTGVARALEKAENELVEMNKRKDELLALVAQDKVIDKADFMQRLDLESFAGRNRANVLLKRLGVSVLAKGKAGKEKKHDIYIMTINGEKQSIFIPIAGGVGVLGLTNEQKEKVRDQGLDGTQATKYSATIAKMQLGLIKFD
jgi:DNA invertase Pin-like site-specific DNA recombinase